MVDQTEIIEEGLSNIGEIIYLVDKLRGMIPEVPEGKRATISNPELPRTIYDICDRQAMAYSCLFDDAKTRMKEPPPQRRLRHDRVRLVKDTCGNAEFPNLANKGVRNALVHWDDFMLDAIMRGVARPSLTDLAFSHRDGFGFDASRLLLIRVYFAETDVIHLFDHELHVGALKAEAQLVLDRFGYEVALKPDA